jgi:hypothetical protein
MADKKPNSLDELFATIARQYPPPPKPKRLRLGTRGKKDSLDLSDFLVHFAKGDAGYNTVMSILWSQVVKRGATPFGCAARQKGLDLDTQRAVCFSEAPLGFLHRLVHRRGTRYGIGFSKKFILERGGAPLWYLQRGTIQQGLVAAMMRSASSPFDAKHPIWGLTPFIDFPSPQPFQYDFRWEREWRVRGDVRFSVHDVAFLFLPGENHEAAWSFFEDMQRRNEGPAYFCAYIDPTWKVERVESALESHFRKTKALEKKKTQEKKRMDAFIKKPGRKPKERSRKR